jgi:hypothetical protein
VLLHEFGSPSVVPCNEDGEHESHPDNSYIHSYSSNLDFGALCIRQLDRAASVSNHEDNRFCEGDVHEPPNQSLSLRPLKTTRTNRERSESKFERRKVVQYGSQQRCLTRLLSLIRSYRDTISGTGGKGKPTDHACYREPAASTLICHLGTGCGRWAGDMRFTLNPSDRLVRMPLWIGLESDPARVIEDV